MRLLALLTTTILLLLTGQVHAFSSETSPSVAGHIIYSAKEKAPFQKTDLVSEDQEEDDFLHPYQETDSKTPITYYTYFEPGIQNNAHWFAQPHYSFATVSGINKSYTFLRIRVLRI